MPPYTLDYTDAPPAPSTGPRSRLRLPSFRVLLTGGLVVFFGFSLAGNALLLDEQRNYRKSADRQALQYDSLLSAKLISDKQISDLRFQLLELRRQQEQLQQQLPGQKLAGN